MRKIGVFSKVILCTCVSLWSMQTMAYIVSGNATITNSTPGLSNNTTQSGISMTSGGTATLTISGDVNLANNSGTDPAGYGVYVNNGSTLNFVGENGTDTLNITGSSQRGMHLNGGTTTTFTNMNVSVGAPGTKGNTLCAHGTTVFTGNGNNFLNLTGSTDGHGLHVYSNSGYDTAQTTITDMNIEATGNNYGIGVGGESASVSAGILNISSSSGQNTLKMNNNLLGGLAMGKTADVNIAPNPTVNITNMNIEANNNGSGSDMSENSTSRGAGIYNYSGALTITGNGANSLNSNSNVGAGINSINNTNAPNAALTIRDMNITSSSNGAQGLYVSNMNGEISSSTGNNTLNMSGNGYEGISVDRATMAITNMNIIANNNGNVVDGTFVRNGITNAGNLTITGNGSQNMQVNNNALNGIGGNVLTNQMGSLSINGMNIEVNENKGRGIYLYETTANISGANGTNTLNVSGNGYEGLLLSKSQMDITNMNIIANGNGFTSDNAGYLSGISTNDRLTITGTGSQILQANSNQGSGVYLGNFTTILGNADFSLSNMNIQIFSNGVHGFQLNNGTAKLTGNGTNAMVIQDNSKDGLHIESGTMTISDMDVDTSKNDQRGIGMGNGNNPVKLEISSTSGLNTLSVNENGYEGISVSDNAATLTLKNMNIEVNKNGFKAREAGDSASGFSVWGTVDIEGNGNNYIQVNGNERAGLAIAKRDTDVITPKVTISNMNMSANENAQQGIDVSADDGPGGTSFAISSTHNNSLVLNNNGLEGLRVSKGGNATISDMNIGISGNGSSGIAVVDSQTSISSSRRNNQLQLANNATSNILIQNLGEMYAKDATLTIDGMTVLSSGSTFASLQNSTIAYTAKLAMSNSQLILGSNNQVFDLNKGNVELTNVQQSGTQPVSLVTNTGTSTFKALNNSSVTGKITDNGQLTSTLSDNSTWKMLDSSNMYQLNVSDSSIDMRSQSGGYNTLTVGNAYLADNATLYMNTNMDETQLTDQLVLLDGSHIVGKTNLNITNTAPATSYGTFIKGDGIKVVDAQGSTFTGADTFDLVGKKIDTGLYIQELYYQNLGTSDESWYIRTATEDDGGGNKGSDGSYSNGKKPKPTDLTKTVANMPAVALSVVKTINSELRNRLGELRSNNPKAHNGLWARGYMKSLEVDEKIKNEMDIYGFEAGYDHLISKDNQARTYLGIMAGYAQVDKIKVDQDNGYKGKGDGSVPSVGAYLTWINKNGWYTDTVVRGFLTKLDITNYSAQGLPITYDADRMAVAGSFEFGRRTALYQKGRNGFIVEPKAQVVYTYMPSKDHKTSLGQKIKYDTTQSLVTRAALMAAYRRTFANGMALEPYIQVGVAYEWLGKTDVNFIGSDFTSDVSGATFEGVLGINARLSRGWHMYGDFTVEKGSVYDSYGGHLGLRYNF